MLPDIVCLKDREGRWLFANTSCRQLFDLDDQQYIGKSGAELARLNAFCQRTLPAWELADAKTWNKGKPESSEEIFFPRPEEQRIYQVTRIPSYHADGSRQCLFVLGRDITGTRRVEAALDIESQSREELEGQLREKDRLIERTSTTIEVLLERNEAAQRALEDRIVTNLKERLLPLLDLLRSKLAAKDHFCLDIITSHIDNISSSFVKDLKSPALNLTPREIQLADLVMQGRSNKEIADLLNISVRSVESHRYSLRTKLGLRNKKVNLRTYLLSLFTP